MPEMGLNLLLRGFRFVGMLYLLASLSILLHELAHLLAALAMKMRIKKIAIGPETTWGFRIGIVFLSPLLIPAHVEAEAVRETFSSIKMAFFVFSGPFISLSMALLFFLLHNSPGGYINLALLISSLLPFPRGKTDMGSILSAIDQMSKNRP